MLRPEDVGEGPVWDQAGVKITAFEVDHAPVRPALGYRIDYAGHSIVLSGDTRQSDNLIRQAQGADLGRRVLKRWGDLSGESRYPEMP
jgi:ribonuclease Z